MALLPLNTPNIGSNNKWMNIDMAYLANGNYITDPKKSYTSYYPFRSLFTGRKTDERYFNVHENSDSSLTFFSTIGIDIPSYTVFDNVILSEPAVIKAELQNNNTSLLKVFLPKAETPIVYNSYNDSYFLTPQNNDCGENTSDLSQQIPTQDRTLKLISNNSDNCYIIPLSDLSQSKAYLISIAHKHLKGKPLQFSIMNQDSRKADIDVNLSKFKDFSVDYFIIPPGKKDGFGYNLFFNNKSIGLYATENELGDIQVYEIPYNYLTTLTFSNRSESRYNQTVAYFYSYHKEFKAYAVKKNALMGEIFPFVSGVQLKNHYRVNNWANGWEVDCTVTDCKNSNFVVIFWPQYFQFAGFGIGLLTFGGIIILKKKTKLNHTPIVIQ